MKFPLTVRLSFLLLFITLFFFGIIAARQFLYPIVLAFFLSYLLYPIVNFLERKRFPRILANFVAILLGTIVIAGLAILLFNQLGRFAKDLPNLNESGFGQVTGFVDIIERRMGLPNQEVSVLLREQLQEGLVNIPSIMGSMFSSTAGTLVAIGIMPVYVFLFLYYRTKFAYFILKLTSAEHRKEALEILHEISTVAAKYMVGVFVVVLILCFLNTAGLAIIGVQHAIALGIISALFNLIPYFGTLLGGAVPLLYVLLAQNDPVLTLRVVILFVIIQFIENNILTPNIVGSNVQINPFFVIVGLVAAAMVWGIPGMLVVVPTLAIMRIVFGHMPRMEPYAFLLGVRGTERHAITLDKIKGLFKRK